MSFDQEGLFNRGTSYVGANGPAPASTDGQAIEGVEKRFSDEDYSTGYLKNAARVAGQNLYNLCRVIRNETGLTFPVASLLLHFKDGTATQIDGYTTTDGQRGIVGDEWLTYNVQAHDLFWGVVTGLTTILTDPTGGANNVITIASEVSALTSACSSQGLSGSGVTAAALTAGRVKQATFAGATSPLANEVMHYLGWAMSGATTANTNFKLLVNLRETGVA